MGLARVGSVGHNFSGDIFLAFSTGNHVPDFGESLIDLKMMPHSPYFCPGYLAPLQMAAIEPLFDLFEYLYIQPEAWLYKSMPLPEQGDVPIPNGVGLGMEPDPAIIQKYRVQ